MRFYDSRAEQAADLYAAARYERHEGDVWHSMLGRHPNALANAAAHWAQAIFLQTWAARTAELARTRAGVEA